MSDPTSPNSPNSSVETMDTLETKYPDRLLHKILSLSGGRFLLVLRRPTQEEVIEHEDRISILTETAKGPSNLEDDGDKQILSCIVYPDSVGIAKIQRLNAALASNLRKFWLKLAGNQTVTQEDDESAIPQAIRDKNKAKELVAFRLKPPKVHFTDEELADIESKAITADLDPKAEIHKAAMQRALEQSKLIVLSRFSTIQLKMFQAKSKQGLGQFRVKRHDLVAAMEQNLVHPDKQTLYQWGEECPYLRYDLAQLLFGSANADIEEYEGK